MVILAVTGTYSVILHSNDLGDILGGAYGQVLALKVGLFVALVALGAINLRRLTPRLLGNVESAPKDGGPASRLGRNIRMEVGLGAMALLCAGGLTLLPPPSDEGVQGEPVGLWMVAAALSLLALGAVAVRQAGWRAK